MAVKKPVSVVPADEQEKFYLIVNPHGTMHVVSETHARARLKQVGWRVATETEKQAYFAADGNQRANRPLAKPYSPAKELEAALPVEAVIEKE